MRSGQCRFFVVSALCISAAGCREETSFFSLQVITRAPEVADWSALSVEVSGPDLRSTFRRSDFNREAGSSTQFLSRTVKLRGSGTLAATVMLPGPVGTRPAEVRVSFPVEPDWRYGISVFIGGPRPGPFFCGQLGGAAALPSAPAESLFVATGGSPQDAVC
jgi:hypothetical protein